MKKKTMPSKERFYLSVVGGQRLASKPKLMELVPPAVLLLTQGWSVFLRSSATPGFSCEVKWEPDGETTVIPSDGRALPTWTKNLAVLFSGA